MVYNNTMNEVADTNDIVFQTPGLDIAGGARYIYEHLMGNDWDALMATITHIWNAYSIFALLISLLFFAGFVYAKIKYDELATAEMQEIRNAEKAWSARHEVHGSISARWDAIQERVTEHNPASWRIAIIEADIMLDETLTNAGYGGQSLGEKLKSANTASFTTLQDAWEAHKVRNEIAHAGSDFVLTQRVAQETLLQYERVFREFGVL